MMCKIIFALIILFIGFNSLFTVVYLSYSFTQSLSPLVGCGHNYKHCGYRQREGRVINVEGKPEYKVWVVENGNKNNNTPCLPTDNNLLKCRESDNLNKDEIAECGHLVGTEYAVNKSLRVWTKQGSTECYAYNYLQIGWINYIRSFILLLSIGFNIRSFQMLGGIKCVMKLMCNICWKSKDN